METTTYGITFPASTRDAARDTLDPGPTAFDLDAPLYTLVLTRRQDRRAARRNISAPS